MISEKKQAELDRYRILVLATLDYRLKLHGGMIVYDGDDFMTEFYTLEKIKAEKYYQERRLDRLEKKLAQQINSLQRMIDLDFEGYIKTTTGFDIDIFEDLRNRVETILANKQIHNEKELSDIHTMKSYHQKVTKDNKAIKVLDSLAIDYFSKAPKRNEGHSHVISKTEKDGIEESKVMFYTGPKLKHFKELEELSPDGKCTLAVRQTGFEEHSSTNVSIHSPEAHGEIYRVNDICDDIKAYWKGNQTVVIETRKDYKAYPQYNQLRSFDIVVNIEYVER